MSIFSHDVFISFAHQNNQDGWVDEFHNELNIQLSYLLPYEPKIWRDKSLTRADDFSQEIFDRLQTTKVFVSLLSPVYLTRPWCRDELRSFHKNAEQSSFGLKINIKSRILYAELTFVEPENIPSELNNTLGYEFFELDKQSQRRRMYGHRPDDYMNGKFKDAIANLASDINEILRGIDKQIDSKEPQSNKPKVYLAETIFELEKKRSEMRNELEARGYQVVPPESVRLTPQSPDYETAVDKYLMEAKLSVHLIGEKYGLVPENATKSIVELQNDCAARLRSQGTLQSMIWISEEVNIEKLSDSRQADFLNYLLNNEQAQMNAEPWQVNYEVFKKQKVLNKLGKIEETPAPSVIKRIYIMCDQRDYESGKSVKKFLFDHGFEPFLPKGLGNHEKFLKSCDATLIYYGSSDEDWVALMILDLSNTISLRQDNPFLCKAVFLADPVIPEKEEFYTNSANILKYDNQSIETSLKPFIECLQKKLLPTGGA